MAKVEETFCYGYTTRWGPDGRPPVRRCWKKMRGQRIEPRPEGERNTERDISDVATCSLNFRPVKYKGCLYKDRPAVYISLSLSLSLSCLRNLHQILDVSLNIVGFQRVKRWCFLFPLSRNTQHTTPCYETRSRNEFLFLLDFIHLSIYIFRYLESQRWC